MSQGQIKGRLDKQTLKKQGKGLLIAATGAAALYLLKFAGTVNVGQWTPLIGAMVPFMVNAIKEWMKGE